MKIIDAEKRICECCMEEHIVQRVRTMDSTVFKNIDIDFLAEKHSGIVIKYEVKTDRKAHETGNIVFEKTTSGHIGCLEKSHADYILYFLSQTKELYGFWLDDIRQYIKKTNPNVIDMGDAATGYLLKISDLERNKVIKKVLTF